VTTVSLYWPDYRLFPYERIFAVTEARALLCPRALLNVETRGLTLDTAHVEAARRLTYFSKFQREQDPAQPTTQHLIETQTSGGTRRQSTRYSVHGLHEYKGKFNPQVARSILNSAGLPRRATVLDPFCGSGTTLVECAHAGFRGVGTDINPLATLIANVKAKALACDPGELVASASAVVRAAKKSRASLTSDLRIIYLRRWFEESILRRLEALRFELEARDPSISAILLVVASNLLREFSLQEPQDLRIRRRKAPPSERDLYDSFIQEVDGLASNLCVVQRHLNLRASSITAHCTDIRLFATKDRPSGFRGKFQAAITSPPYAMALPYIDTQRLSLVWIGLIGPEALPALDAALIGSREFNGSPRGKWERNILENTARLPRRHTGLCRLLLQMVGNKDGFRRRAVPGLLYRYLVGMRDSFLGVRSLLRAGAPFFLIAGTNHTVLNGKRFDIPTPTLLAELARTVGFELEGHEALQAYQRYGLHMKNAIGREELLTLRAI
jgi:16S rRNA G966 N2-methylase RsmD